MPPASWRWASTLASTGPPAALAAAASRARSAGLADGSRPTLLSPQATRSGAGPGGRARLSRPLAWNRASTGPTTPGWTKATLGDPAGAGAGRTAQKAPAATGGARPAGPGPASRAAARARQGEGPAAQ